MSHTCSARARFSRRPTKVISHLPQLLTWSLTVASLWPATNSSRSESGGQSGMATNSELVLKSLEDRFQPLQRAVLGDVDRVHVHAELARHVGGTTSFEDHQLEGAQRLRVGARPA